MPVGCVFFDREFSPACQVFHVAGAAALSPRVQRRLEERYCQRGTFIGCPLYQRVERCLHRAHTLVSRTQRPRELALPTGNTG